MPAPIASSLSLPDDTGNPGKKFRTITKVIAGVTVHENLVLPDLGMTVTGKYFFSSPQQSVVQSAHNGTSTAFFWFQVPIAATITAQLRFLSFDCNVSAATAAPTAPLISCTKFTFTGTASGASSATLPAQTANPAAQMIARTAVTGMTVTLVSDFCSFSVPTLTTAVGQFFGGEICLEHNPQSFSRGLDLEVGPGEGIVIWQSVGGTVTDTRRFAVQLEWLELDLT